MKSTLCLVMMVATLLSSPQLFASSKACEAFFEPLSTMDHEMDQLVDFDDAFEVFPDGSLRQRTMDEQNLMALRRLTKIGRLREASNGQLQLDAEIFVGWAKFGSLPAEISRIAFGRHVETHVIQKRGLTGRTVEIEARGTPENMKPFIMSLQGLLGL